MAFTRAPATSLALYGGPGQPLTPLSEAQSATDTVSVSVTDTSSLIILSALSASDTVSVSLSESSSLLTAEVSTYVTELGLYGGPRPYQHYAAATAPSLLDVTVSDTLSVQWTEEPVDTNEALSADTVRLSVSEVSSLAVQRSVFDTAQISISEVVSLLQTGVTAISASDAASVSLTEASALGVSLVTSDTLSATFSGEASALSTTVTAITASDTASVSLSEASLLGVFTGVLAINLLDDVRVSMQEVSDVIVRVPTKPMRIRIVPRNAQIRITPI